MKKLIRRLKEEPLVPLGCALTVWALYKASKSMRAGDHARTNVYFRRRIYAQGFTLLAVVAGGMYWGKDREKRREWDQLQKAKTAEERRKRWLDELEYRDREEKRLRGVGGSGSGSDEGESTASSTRCVLDEIERRDRLGRGSAILKAALDRWT